MSSYIIDMNQTKRIVKIRVKHDNDYDADTSYLTEHLGISESMTEKEKQEAIRFDNERLRMLEDGAYSYLYIYAEAEVVIGNTVQTITSGGIGGVESDNEGAISEYDGEELDCLKDQLIALGFDEKEIDEVSRTVNIEVSA